jgi:hypothetical protein
MLGRFLLTAEGSVLPIKKREAQKYDKEKFSLKKLNDVEVKGQHRDEISTRFAALENLNDKVDINRAWESIRKNIETSAKECLGYAYVILSQSSINMVSRRKIKIFTLNDAG